MADAGSLGASAMAVVGGNRPVRHTGTRNPRPLSPLSLSPSVSLSLSLCLSPVPLSLSSSLFRSRLLSACLFSLPAPPLFLSPPPAIADTLPAAVGTPP